MKKFHVLMLFAAVAFTACELNEELPDRLLGNAPAAIGPVESSLEGVLMSQGQVYGMQELSSDEMIGPTRGADWDDGGVWRQFHLHEWDANNGEIGNGFNGLQTGILRASQAVFGFEQEGNAESAAQARVLRAYMLWQVIDLFGSTPYRVFTEDIDVLEAPPVLGASQAIDTVINDLTVAASILPDRASAGYSRYTKEACYAMLAKVYLNKFIYDGATSAPSSDMDQVIANADLVINSGQFSLESGDNYFVNNFGISNEGSTESVFFLENTGGGSDNSNFGSRNRMTLHYNQNPSSWNGFTTIADFYNRWDTTDLRFSAPATANMAANSGLRFGLLEGQMVDKDGNNLQDRNGNPLAFTPDVAILGNGEVEGVRIVKYEPDYTDGNTTQHPNNDLPLIRYADVLLMKAEAQFRNGSSGDALTIVNEIRTNRGVPNVAAVAADGQEILDERGFELYWEGHRRTDLIRFGKFNDAWSEKAASQPFRNLYPFPQDAVDSNPNLNQNAGY